jgi:aspartyl-tRNA(Asn)/glutamyl-tRNA(Gln) amidotransferase subunit A
MTDGLQEAKADAIVTPTIPIGAPRAGAATVTIEGTEMPIHTVMTRCTAPFNLTGMPAITLPCGNDRDGMPVSIQFAASCGSDGDLIRLALAAEHALAEQRS